ncbi:MAG: DUF4290 domain-containing protein [Saprospiraceae bacterium]
MIEGLTYNTARTKLEIPAYGRHVQSMLEKAVELDTERQQAFVERIVQMMAQQAGNEDGLAKEDLERRLWKHAYRLSAYQLTATPPDGHIPTPEEDQVPPEEVPYPKSVLKQRNYGEYVQRLISKAIQTEDEERKAAIVNTVACYMKLAYSTYNDAQNISDRTILADLEKMSDGLLTLPEGTNIDAFMGKGTQSHIKQTAPITKRRNNRKKGGGNRNRRRFRKR